MPLSPIQASNTDASRREQRLDTEGQARGLRQYGAITLASGGSTASAAATAAETQSISRWLWAGLAAVALLAVYLILRR